MPSPLHRGEVFFLEDTDNNELNNVGEKNIQEQENKIEDKKIENIFDNKSNTQHRKKKQKKRKL